MPGAHKPSPFIPGDLFKSHKIMGLSSDEINTPSIAYYKEATLQEILLRFKYSPDHIETFSDICFPENNTRTPESELLKQRFYNLLWETNPEIKERYDGFRLVAKKPDGIGEGICDKWVEILATVKQQGDLDSSLEEGRKMMEMLLSNNQEKKLEAALRLINEVKIQHNNIVNNKYDFFLNIHHLDINGDWIADHFKVSPSGKALFSHSIYKADNTTIRDQQQVVRNKYESIITLSNTIPPGKSKEKKGLEVLGNYVKDILKLMTDAPPSLRDLSEVYDPLHPEKSLQGAVRGKLEGLFGKLQNPDIKE